jgi:hypothetical protein
VVFATSDCGAQALPYPHDNSARDVEAGIRLHRSSPRTFKAGQMVDRYTDLYCQVLTKRQS